MEYDFYQNIGSPVNRLIKVGRAFVPKGRMTWLYAVRQEIKCYISYNPEITLNSPISKEIRYDKLRTITGDIFVAEVKVENEI